MTNIVLELIKIILPAAFVLYAVYLTVQSFLTKDFEKKLVELKIKGQDLVLPNRLQAYERLCIYLERINLSTLLNRVERHEKQTVQEFQYLLVNNIRTEFSHNLAQQLYVSSKAWEMLKATTEQLISKINEAGADLDASSTISDFSRKLVELHLKEEQDMNSICLEFVKEEARNLF